MARAAATKRLPTVDLELALPLILIAAHESPRKLGALYYGCGGRPRDNSGLDSLIFRVIPWLLAAARERGRGAGARAHAAQ